MQINQWEAFYLFGYSTYHPDPPCHPELSVILSAAKDLGWRIST